MAQKHFVQLKLGSKSFEPTQISTEGCSYVDDFKESIMINSIYQNTILKRCVFRRDGKIERE